MTQHDDDLSIRQLFRVIFMQGGQVAVGTAIGAGVLLLVGIVAVLLAPIWLPIFAVWYWRREVAKQKAGGGADVTDLAVVTEPAPVDTAALAESRQPTDSVA